jgi:hypothetical protein
MSRLFVKLVIPIGLLLLSPTLVRGEENGGVGVPEEVSLPDDQVLPLNGAEPPREFIFTVYIARLRICPSLGKMPT